MVGTQKGHPRLAGQWVHLANTGWKSKQGAWRETVFARLRPKPTLAVCQQRHMRDCQPFRGFLYPFPGSLNRVPRKHLFGLGLEHLLDQGSQRSRFWPLTSVMRSIAMEESVRDGAPEGGGYGFAKMLTHTVPILGLTRQLSPTLKNLFAKINASTSVGDRHIFGKNYALAFHFFCPLPRILPVMNPIQILQPSHL